MQERARVWVDGVLADEANAFVSAMDHAFTVGDGVFETLKVVDSVPFALARHLRRLRRSADALGIRVPEDDDIAIAVTTVLSPGARSEHPAPRERLRIMVTGGRSPLGSLRGPGPPTLVVAAVPDHPWAPGQGAVRVPWVRNERGATAGLKTTSYAENVRALAFAAERGAGEALFANTRGELCEGTGTNVLVVVGDELLTPPLSSGCLAGITRELFLEWAAAEALPCREADLPFEILADCDEALLTSSTRDVQPLAFLDGRTLHPGPLTAAAVELFTRRASRASEP